MNRALLLLALLFAFSTANAREIRINFDVVFNSMYDFSSETWRSTDVLGGEASVTINLDNPQLWGEYYWESELQQIGTQFGPTAIKSSILDNIYRPDNLEEWSILTDSLTLITNIDYSVSWPETPLGTGPRISMQFNDYIRGTKDSLYWDYIIGFNSPWGGFAVADIKERTANELIAFVHEEFSRGSIFTTGFNSRVLDLITYENLAGVSYQGHATIRGYEIIGAVPEPSVIALICVGLGLMVVSRKRLHP